MKNYIRIFILLYAFWVVLSERTTAESLIVGAVACGLVIGYNRKMIEDRRGYGLRKGFLAVKFMFVLLREIVISNFQVASIILRKDMKIDPQVFEYRTKLKTERYRAVLANAITLTPGTITLSVDGDMLSIHGLRGENVDGVVDSKIEKILIEIEGD